MIGLLIQLLVLCIVFGVIMYIVDQVSFFAPYANIVKVVIAAIFLIALLYMVAGLVGGGSFSLGRM